MDDRKYMPRGGQNNPLEDFNLSDADDLGPKCACILALDISGSMAGAPINALNEGLLKFQQALGSDDLAKHRVDVAVVTFGTTVEVLGGFIPAADFEAATLKADGVRTPMAAAVNKSLDILEDQKEFYRLRGNPVYRPWVFLITDGQPSDREEWQQAVDRVREAERNKKVVFWAVGVPGADQAKLAELSVRKPWVLKGLQFGPLFQWLSNSLSAVSNSTPGEEVPLAPPSDDFVIR